MTYHNGWSCHGLALRSVLECELHAVILRRPHAPGEEPPARPGDRIERRYRARFDRATGEVSELAAKTG